LYILIIVRGVIARGSNNTGKNTDIFFAKKRVLTNGSKSPTNGMIYPTNGKNRMNLNGFSDDLLIDLIAMTGPIYEKVTNNCPSNILAQTQKI